MAQPEEAKSASAAPLPEETPEKKRGLPGGLTGNALVSGVVSAIVAGTISLGVAHYQSQDAARQALAGQQAAAVVQLETAATTFFQATLDLQARCGRNPDSSCTDMPAGSPYMIDNQTFNTDRLNISDPRVYALAAQFYKFATTAIDMVGTDQEATNLDGMGETYQELITRCGQLIRGQ